MGYRVRTGALALFIENICIYNFTGNKGVA